MKKCSAAVHGLGPGVHALGVGNSCTLLGQACTQGLWVFGITPVIIITPCFKDIDSADGEQNKRSLARPVISLHACIKDTSEIHHHSIR